MLQKRVRRGQARVRAAVAALSSVAIAPAVLADKTWNTAVSSGQWNTPSNWLENAVPTSADSVFIHFTDAADHTITYDGNYSSSNDVYVRNVGGGNATLSTTAPFNLTATNLRVGDTGRGAAVQSAGTYTLKNALSLGTTSAGAGSYTLSGAGVINIDGSVAASPRLNVGDYGNATFTQTGGAITVGPGSNSSYVMIGQNAGSNGRYIMTGGSLSSAFLIGIGYYPASGSTPAARGTFEQSGGTVTATDSLDVGSLGYGTYIQTGGTVSAGFSGPSGFYHRLYVGHSGGAQGYYSLSGTAVLSTAETMMGYNPGAFGTFVQTGGTHTSGGATVGQFGNCTYTQSAGTFNLTGGSLNVGAYSGSQGTFNLSGTGVIQSNSQIIGGFNGGANPARGTFNQTGGLNLAATDVYLGHTGIGSYSQSGGTFSVGNTLYIAAATGSSGTYNLTGGTLNATYIRNRGAINWTGGALNTSILFLSGGGSLTLSPNAPKVLKAAISIATSENAKLNLNDNKLITTNPVGSWNGSAYTDITGLVRSGRGNGTWNGAGIITSMTSATNASNYTSLGVATASQVKGISFTATALWGGQTVSGSDTLVMYTYGGDANLSGFVDIDDYGLIDFNASTGGALKGWYNGDFDYNGLVDIDDYGIIDFVVNAQGAPFASADSLDFTHDFTPMHAVSPVPEPATFAFLALTPIILSRRASARRFRSRSAAGRRSASD